MKFGVIERYFEKIDWDKIFGTFVDRTIQIILVSILFIILYKVGQFAISHVLKNIGKTDRFTKNRVTTIYTLINNAYFYVLLLFYVYAVLSVFGLPVGTLVASAGIFSLAIGLGAQGFVNDLLTGFLIIAEQQFDVGDYVKLGSVEGTVVAIGLRTTKVKSADGTLNFIPNRNILVVSNLSRNDMRALINIRIAPDTDIEKIKEAVAKVNDKLVPKNPEIIDGPTYLGVEEISNGDLSFQIVMHVKNGQQYQIRRKFLQAYLLEIKNEGISLPVPNKSETF